MQSSETIHPDKSQFATGYRPERTITQVVRYTADEGSDGRVHLFYTPTGNLAIRFLNDFTFRMKLFAQGSVDWTTTQAVEPVASFKIAQTEFAVEAHAEESVVTLSTSALRVVVWKYPFRLQVFTTNGALVYQTESASIDKTGAVTWTAQSEPTEHFYGLGEKTSFLDKRGERYEMWNTDIYAPHVPEIEAMYESIPLLLHMRERLTYGVFLDNPGRTVFDMRSRSDAYTIQTETGALDLYLFLGPSLKEVVERYTGLTGRMNLPPKWALGYHQSRYSYMDQAEVLDLARTFREKEIPCDVIHLDIHYMDGYRVFTFDEERFPDPKEMVAELREMGFRVVPIVDPGVKRDPDYAVYRNGVLEDVFCKRLEGPVYTGNVWPGESAFPDFTEDRVSDWWAEQQRFYIDLGITGIWNDMNEPAVFNETKTMDKDVMHRNNGMPKTHRELHNIYGMLMSKATYEGLRRDLNGERPFVLTRAGYSGVQRYAAVWTGDNRSFWEHMAMAMPMVLNLGLSGIPFAGPDVGGFAHHTTGELLTRWTQMGAFFPFFRNHSALETVRQEPWAFGEPYETIIRHYINWRYRWMPHLYSLFYEATQTGVPVMRPLIFEYPDDTNVSNLCDQFLLGQNVMVAPVYRPDTTARSVYLPHGVWYDYWSGERFSRPGHVLADAPLDQMPIYIKAGTIIAEQPERDSDDVLFHIYAGNPDGKSEFTFYEDDGITFDYESGQFNLWDIEVTEDKTGDGKSALAPVLCVDIHHRHSGYTVTRKSIQLCIHHLDFLPSSVNGETNLSSSEDFETQSEGWYFNTDTGTLAVKVPSDTTSVTVR